MRLSDYILAYRAVKDQRAKEAAYKKLVGTDPDYTIIKDLIDHARTDVVATVTFPNGTKLDFHKRDAFDKLQAMDPDRAGAF